MLPRTFDVSVIQRAQTDLIGIVLRTNIEKSQTDCQHLWRRFMPRVQELLPARGDTANMFYGVCTPVDLDMGVFDYWATVPMPRQSSLPAGMQSLSLPAGLYAECPVSSLGQLKPAYAYLYRQWPKEQQQYAPDHTRPCLEIYDQGFTTTGSLRLCIPVKAR